MCIRMTGTATSSQKRNMITRYPSSSPWFQGDEYTYSYDGAWKDLLVNYNGEEITYDAIGNPLDYRGYEMVWSGRQLRQMKNENDNLAFTYDENGMRVGKRVITITGNRGTLKNTSYTYADSQLASEVRTGTNGAAEAKLLYSYKYRGNACLCELYINRI